MLTKLHPILHYCHNTGRKQKKIFNALITLTSKFTFDISKHCCNRCKQWGNRKSPFDTTSCYWFTVFVFSFDLYEKDVKGNSILFFRVVTEHTSCVFALISTDKEQFKKKGMRGKLWVLCYCSYFEAERLELLAGFLQQTQVPTVTYRRMGVFSFLFHTAANNANVKTHGFAFTCSTLICYSLNPMRTNSASFIMSCQSSVRSDWDNNDLMSHIVTSPSKRICP